MTFRLWADEMVAASTFLGIAPWPAGSQPSNRASRLLSLLIISMGGSAAAPNRFFCQSALDVVAICLRYSFPTRPS